MNFFVCFCLGFCLFVISFSVLLAHCSHIYYFFHHFFPFSSSLLACFLPFFLSFFFFSCFVLLVLSCLFFFLSANYLVSVLTALPIYQRFIIFIWCIYQIFWSFCNIHFRYLLDFLVFLRDQSPLTWTWVTAWSKGSRSRNLPSVMREVLAGSASCRGQPGQPPTSRSERAMFGFCHFKSVLVELWIFKKVFLVFLCDMEPA